MIDLVTKFVSWIKDTFVLVTGLPGLIGGFVSSMATFLSWLPFGLGNIITGLIITCVVFVTVYAIVKLVASLL